MAFANKGNGGTVGSGTVDQASIVLTTATTALSIGNLGVLIVGGDNAQTTDGDENMVTSVTDSAGNQWIKAVEFTNGQGTQETGTTCSMWYTNCTKLLNIGGTITANFSVPTARDDMCIGLRIYTLLAGWTAHPRWTATLADDAVDPGILNPITANMACLRIRAISSEFNSVAAITVTPGFTTFGWIVRSRNNAAAQTIRGEFIISTGTFSSSNPTYVAADHASVYAAFIEVPPLGSYAGIQELDVPTKHFRHEMIDMDA